MAGLAGLVLGILAIGCSAADGPPEEFPPVHFGMTADSVRRAVAKQGGRVEAESAHSFLVVERDRRIEQEVFFFYRERLAAYTVRYAEEASSGNFRRLARRYTLAYGEPIEERYDDWVMRAAWRMEEDRGRLLLSGFVGGRGTDSPLMARIEDPSVMPRLLRLLEEEGAGNDLAD
jgi:hypothetical protein